MWYISMTKKVDERSGVLLFIDKNAFVYCDFFWIQYIPQKVLNKFKTTYIAHSIFGMQDDDSIRWYLNILQRNIKPKGWIKEKLKKVCKALS